MLLRFSVGNFLSFDSIVTFDMFPYTRRRKHKHHIYDRQHVLSLKLAAIYGENGAGKSNFVKAIDFMRLFAVRKDFLTLLDYGKTRFMLKENNDTPIVFSVEFMSKERVYVYRAAIGETVEESLSLSGLGKGEERLVFRRKDTALESDCLLGNGLATKLLERNPLSSVLPLNKEFPILESADLDNATDWFETQLLVINFQSFVPKLIDMMSRDGDLLRFSNLVFKKVRIASSVDVRETPFEQWSSGKDEQTIRNMLRIGSDKAVEAVSDAHRNLFNYQPQTGMVKELMFALQGKDGFRKDMDITTQSDGTVRLLTLVPAIYEAMHHGKVVLVDEIENCIHPNLVKSLVAFFSSSETTGQLIFTTHLTKLLDQEMLRLDEIWLTEKEDGATTMRSLNDFKIHSTIDIEKGYLDGRYGGAPLIDSFGNE